MAMNRRKFLRAAGVGAGLGGLSMTGASWAFHNHGGGLLQPSYGEISNLEILGYSNMFFDKPGAPNGPGWDQTYEFQVSRDGRYAYTSHQIGWSILDVSNPRDMRVIARVQNDTSPRQRTQYIHIQGGDVLVVKETSRLSFWDVSRPDMPTKVGEFVPHDVRGGFHGLWVHEARGRRYAMGVCNVATHRGDILLIVDITTPREPREVARWGYPGQEVLPPAPSPFPPGITVQAHDLTTYRDRAYVAWRDKGLIILNIENPAAPSMVGELNWSDGRPGMFSLPGQTHSWGIVIPKHGGAPETIVGGDEFTRSTQCPWGHAHFIDIRDERNPKEISRFMLPLNMEGQCPGNPAGGTGDGRDGVRFGIHDVERMIRGDILWSAWEEAGFWGIRFSDIHNPKPIAYYVPPVRSDSPTRSGHADDVFVHDNGVIFGSSSDTGAGGLWAMRHKPGVKGTVVWNADNSGVIVSDRRTHDEDD